MSNNIIYLPGLQPKLQRLSCGLSLLSFARELAEESERTGDRLTLLEAYRVAVAADHALWPLCAWAAQSSRGPRNHLEVFEYRVLNHWSEAMGLRGRLWRRLWRTPGRVLRSCLDRLRRRELGQWKPANDPLPTAA